MITTFLKLRRGSFFSNWLYGSTKIKLIKVLPNIVKLDFHNIEILDDVIRLLFSVLQKKHYEWYLLDFTTKTKDGSNSTKKIHP
jgi:hypothetical protein